MAEIADRTRAFSLFIYHTFIYLVVKTDKNVYTCTPEKDNKQTMLASMLMGSFQIRMRYRIRLGAGYVMNYVCLSAKNQNSHLPLITKNNNLISIYETTYNCTSILKDFDYVCIYTGNKILSDVWCSKCDVHFI